MTSRQISLLKNASLMTVTWKAILNQPSQSRKVKLTLPDSRALTCQKLKRIVRRQAQQRTSQCFAERPWKNEDNPNNKRKKKRSGSAGRLVV